MASAFTHAIAAVTIGKSCFPARQSYKLWLLGIFCAVVPDADALGFYLGVPYDSIWGHRGITHSILFALLLSLAVMLLFYRALPAFQRPWWIFASYFFLSTVSHPLFDACTNGGLGVAFFSPFIASRYFFPFHPIQVSPIGVGAFFSEWGLQVLASELQWVWLPCLILIFALSMRNKRAQ